MAFDFTLSPEAPKAVSRIPLSEGDAPSSIVLDDANFLLSAKFKKVGGDLVLTGADGQKLVIEGYFNHAKRPDLMAAGGGTLTAELVEQLAGPENPGQYAQVGAPAGATVIGRVERVGGTATVQRANGLVEELQVGSQVLQGDIVETRDDSQLGISFNDGTAFNLGTNARMVLNELVYSANSSSNSGVFSLVKGSIAFVAGQAAKSGEMKIVTPISTMGIRGTTVNTVITTDAFGNTVSVAISLMSDPDGSIGRVSIIDPRTDAILATMNSTDTTAVVTQTTSLSILAQLTQKTPEMIQQELAVAQLLFPIFLSNPANFANLPQPQDLQPRAASLGTSSIFTDTRTITETITVTIIEPPAPSNNNQGRTQSQTQTVDVFIPANIRPLVTVDTPPGLVEAANADPGIGTSVANVTISDLDGTANFDLFSLAGAGWINLGNGTLSKVGNFGTVYLDISNKTLTYVLDNAKADSLRDGDVVTDQFVIPVVDDDNELSSAVATFTVEGANDAPVAVNDSYTVVLGQTLHVSAASGVLANDTDAENDQFVALFEAMQIAGSFSAAFSLDGGTDGTLGDLFNPPGWLNQDGIGSGTPIRVFDSSSSPGQGLVLSGPAFLTFTFLGSEAGFLNAAYFGDELLFLNFGSAGGDTGSLSAEAGLIEFLFRSITAGQDGPNGGPIGADVLLAFALAGDHRAYAFFDDIALGDRDFDDMVVRIDINPDIETSDGLLTFNPDGSFDFRPFFTGTAAFTYRVNDGSLDSANTSTVTIDVSLGPDTYDFSSSNADTQVVLSDTPGGSHVVTPGGQQTLADGINNVTGGFGRDTIAGNSHGGVLNGGGGDDIVIGGSGDDIIIGGMGNDHLSGGAGDDIFVFRLGFGHDVIADFDVGDSLHHDVIDLRGLGFTSIQDVLDQIDAGPNAVIHAGFDDITINGVTRDMLAAHASHVFMI